MKRKSKTRKHKLAPFQKFLDANFIINSSLFLFDFIFSFAFNVCDQNIFETKREKQLETTHVLLYCKISLQISTSYSWEKGYPQHIYTVPLTMLHLNSYRDPHPKEKRKSLALQNLTY